MFLHPEFKKLIESLPLFFYLSIFFIIASPFVLAAILNCFAKAAKLNSTYIQVLNVFLFSSSPYIILFPLQLLSIFTKFLIVHSIVSWISSLWGIALVIVGISTALSISKKRSVFLYLAALFIIFAVFILLGVVFTAIRSQGKKAGVCPIVFDKDIGKGQKIVQLQRSPGKESMPVEKIDKEELNKIIVSLAQPYGIDIDFTEGKDTFLEVHGIAEDIGNFFNFVNDFKDYKIRAEVDSMRKLEEGKNRFVIRCYYASLPPAEVNEQLR